MNKEKIYYAFRHILEEKINLVKTTLEDLKEMGKNETKSTAGDKHETALAMVQLEQEKMRNQLGEAMKQLEFFEKIDPLKTSAIGAKGSIINTDRGNFFLGIALGKIQVEDNMIMSVSPYSPLGLKLMGCKAGEYISVNKVYYLIKEVT